MKTEVTHSLDIGPQTSQLSVAMNAEDSGEAVNDFDLYLIQGPDADITKAICAENVPRQFGYCEVEDPASGPWQIVL